MSDANAVSAKPARTEDEWRQLAKGMIKAELSRENLTYSDLAALMSAIGVEENEASIRNKLSRGAFPFVFALQVFDALGLEFIVTRKAGPGYAVELPDMPAVKLPPAALAALLKAMGGK